MSPSEKILSVSLQSEAMKRLEQVARDLHMPVHEAAADLLVQALQARSHETVRIVQMDKSKKTAYPENDPCLEIIRRQDNEITWLREQLTRLSTITPTTHIIRHEYPAFTMDRPNEAPAQSPDTTGRTETQTAPDNHQESQASQVSVDDVQYTPLSEPSGEVEDIISPDIVSTMQDGLMSPGKAGNRMLRDSIGGVREEKDYSITEAAAIAGETEAVILEYIMDGFLPAKRENETYRIRGNDLRRYIMSK